MFSTAEAILCGSYTPLGQVQIGPLDSLAGQLKEYQIPAGIISTLKLADLAVTVDKLGLSSVIDSKVAAGAGIVESKLNLDFPTSDLDADIQTRLLAATYLAHDHSLADPTQIDHANVLNVLTSQHHVKTVSNEISLASLLEKNHASLASVTSDQHHPQSHTLASHSTKAHAELTDVTTSQHHVKTVSNEISLASLLEKNHASLASVTSDQHHPQSHTHTHASTTGRTANDHHAQSHDIASHSDVSITGAQLQSAVLFGGATWMNCAYVTNHLLEVWDTSASMLSNPSTNNQWLLWHLNLPPVKGALKLWVTGVRVGLFDADASNCVSEMLVYGVKYNGRTSLDVTDRTVNKTTQGLHEYVMANNDCSTYENVIVEFLVELTTINALDISSVALLCYYAA